MPIELSAVRHSARTAATSSRVTEPEPLPSTETFPVPGSSVSRPGRLTDDPGTGQVEIAERVDYGEVTRDDVAAVLAEVLRADNTIGKSFDLLGGQTPIAEALAAL